MATADQTKISDQLVRLVQVFFALVLGQSLMLFKDVVVQPFKIDHRLAVAAWATVFYTVVASWVDWHVVMARRPYDTRQTVDRFRFYSDVGIAILYAYLLLTIQPLIADRGATLVYHLMGYPLVFALYLSSGMLRQIVHGRAASKPVPLFIWFGAYIALVVAYQWMFVSGNLDSKKLNWGAIGVTFLLMFGYRSYRRELIKRDEAKEERLVVGIDVDGVLADQITGVLPKVRERHDVSLTYDEITHWRLPIKDSDIEQEILLAQQNREYVFSMSVHPGAGRLLKHIRKFHRVVVITARRGDAGSKWTAEWLKTKGLPFDEVLPSGESKKSEHRTDILVDDFPGNITEFLKNSKGVAVLVDQPWNRDRAELDPFVTEGRLFLVRDLHGLRVDWPDIASAGRKAKAKS